MESKTEGTASLVGSEWLIRGRADVLFRAERSILNAERKDGAVVIPATDEAATDILWFSQRFRLDVLNPGPLRAATARFMMSQAKADSIFGSNYRPAPVNFRKGKSPRKYQSVAADLFRATRSLLLADQLGLGKTISTAAAIVHKDLRPAVIVVPVHLQAQWAEKLHEFIGGLRIHQIRTGKLYDTPQFRRCPQCGRWHEQRVIRGRVVSEMACPTCPVRMRGATSDPDVWITSYHKLDSWSDRLGQIAKCVVYDEVQELRRNKSGKWIAAERLSKQMEYRIGLSATPTHNLGGEIWNVMQCIAPGRLGSRDSFRSTWCDGYAMEGREPKLRDPEEFGSYLRGQHLMLRRTREEVGRELPKHSKVIHTIEADLESLKAIEGRAADLAKIILSANAARGESLNASGQFESILRQQTGIAKAPYVASFVDMLLEDNQPVVLFGWHRAVYDLWMSQLRSHNPVFYTGSESPAQKSASKRAFVSGKTNLLICSLRSGAGLDGLQDRCQTAVFGELDWSPAVHQQCSGRIHRDGQTKPTMSYFLVCDYLTDPLIAQTLGLKKEQSDGLLGITGDDEDRVADPSKHIRRLAELYISRKG